MIKYKDDKETFFINNKFVDKGVLVYMKHNNKLHRLIVDDKTLIDNITRETYESFRKLAVLRKETVKCTDFNLCVDKSIDVTKSIQKLLSSNVSNYVELFRRIKTWNAYLCMLYMTFDWHGNTGYTFDNEPVKEHIKNSVKFISSNSAGIMKRFSNKVYEEINYLSDYFSDLPFKLTFGISIPIYPEYKSVSNAYLTVILILIIFLIFMIFIYYYKLKDA